MRFFKKWGMCILIAAATGVAAYMFHDEISTWVNKLKTGMK